jgi:acetoacetate decarboxylase
MIKKWAYHGPAGLILASHAREPVDQLPVLDVVSALHFKADRTLGLGRVAQDYLG